MTAFFLMYRMNNEYTARGEEPIQGILCLDEEKAAGKLHYLAREWQYFPGKLLTPDMLKEKHRILQPVYFHWRIRRNGTG